MADRDAALARLVGPADGWDLLPAIDYLQTDALQAEGPRAMLHGLVSALLGAGAPIARIRIFFWTLHPLLTGRGYQWTREGGAQEIGIEHSVLESDDYFGSPAEVLFETRAPVRYRLGADGLPKNAHQVVRDLAAAGMTDYYGIPMIGIEGRMEPIFVTTDRPGGFDEGDLAKLDALARYLSPVIQAMSQRAMAIALMETYIGARTGGRVLSGRVKRGDGETIDAALWFCDLRDFTQLTETLEPAVLLSTLNAYFEFVYEAVDAYGGEVLRFIGDAMLIVFPVDGSGGPADACRRALSAAREAFRHLDALNDARRKDGLPEIRFGVGLHVGEVIYGNVGAPARLDFTVMGPAVNRTARLEALTKTVETPILLSSAFAERIDTPTEPKGTFRVKGVGEPLETFAPVFSDT